MFVHLEQNALRPDPLVWFKTGIIFYVCYIYFSTFRELLTFTKMLIIKFAKTLTGKVPSFSRRKVSNFCRPFSSTEAQMDQIRLKVNQSSTIVPRLSLSDVFTLNERKKTLN